MRKFLRSASRMCPGLGLEQLESRLTLSHAAHADASLPFELDEHDRFAPDAPPALQSPSSFGPSSHGEARWSPADFSGAALGRRNGFGEAFSPRMYVVQPMVVQVQFVLVLVDFDVAPWGGSAIAAASSPARNEAPPRGRVEPVAIASSIVAEVTNAPEDAAAKPAATRPAPPNGISVLPVAVASVPPSAGVPTNSAPMLPPSENGASIAHLQPSLMEPVLVPPHGEPLPSKPQSSDVAPDASQPPAAPNEVANVEPKLQQSESLATTTKSDQLPLLAGISLNIEAIDAALHAMLAEVEDVGGELVSWFDEQSPRSWVTMAATAALAGAAGRYAWRARRRRDDGFCEEESSSWLFTRFQSH